MTQQLMRIICAYMEVLRHRRAELPLELDSQNLNQCDQLNFQIPINQLLYQPHLDQLQIAAPILAFRLCRALLI